MFLGLLGFWMFTVFLAWVLLCSWTPGGVRHTPRVSSPYKGKEHSPPDLDIVRARVDVVAQNVRLSHVSHRLTTDRLETPILTDISAHFPSGQVSVIMGPSGSGKSTFLRMCAGRDLNAGLTTSFVPRGKILFNGVQASKRTRHVCAFVEQGPCRTFMIRLT